MSKCHIDGNLMQRLNCFMLLPYILHRHTLLYLFQVSARSVNHTVRTYRPCIQQLYNTTVVLEVNQVLPAEKERESDNQYRLSMFV